MRNRHTRGWIALALLALLSGAIGLARAQDRSEGPARGVSIEEIFRRLDLNGDGRLTRDEVPDAKAFAAADVDADGLVTPDELRDYAATMRRPGAPEPLPAASSGKAIPPSEDGIPALKQLPDSDAVRDAAGPGQLFERRDG